MDTNDDGRLDIHDAITILSQLFMGRDVIPAPGTETRGLDLTDDSLTCRVSDTYSD